MTTSIVRIVVADANVLINLMHVSRLDLCGELPAHEFVVPEHVRAEITDPGRRITLDAAISAGALKLASITELDDLAVFADLIVHIGRGEAACLTLACKNGWSIASDEKRRFRREALARVGSERLLGTADMFVLAIRVGLITVEQADADKATLESRRFKMSFASFREFVK